MIIVIIIINIPFLSQYTDVNYNNNDNNINTYILYCIIIYIIKTSSSCYFLTSYSLKEQ